MTLAPDTLLINGTDLLSIAGVEIEHLSALDLDPPERGEDLVIPGMPGRSPTTWVADAYLMDFPILLLGRDGSEDWAATEQGRRYQFRLNLAAIRTAIGADSIVTLTRRITSGAATTADTTCTARYVSGASLESANPYTARTVLSFWNLSGGWA